MNPSLNTVFSALSDDTRRAILAMLAEGNELSVGEIAAPFAMSLPAVSKHIDVLENAALLVRARRGRTILCRITPAPMEAAMEWLERYEAFWTQRLDALTAYLEDNPWTRETTSRSASSGPSKPRRKKSSRRGPSRKG